MYCPQHRAVFFIMLLIVHIYVSAI